MTLLLLLAPIGLPLAAAGLYAAAGWHHHTTAWAGVVFYVIVALMWLVPDRRLEHAAFHTAEHH